MSSSASVGESNPITHSRREEISALNQLALSGIVPMFNPAHQLFCYRLKKTSAGLVQEGLSRRYTMMTLIGLRHCEDHGLVSPVDILRIFDALLGDLGWVDNIGDFGLLMWTCAAVAPERLPQLISNFNPEPALEKSPASPQRSTMELAWYLAGLAHASAAGSAIKKYVARSAQRSFELLTQNQGARGFFGHSARKGSPSSILRGHIGSFADQVYPIYALSKFGIAYDNRWALEAAVRCARAICDVQGPLGQWWWHYDALRGNVFERYPVYSVHQHGMAPMALFTVQEAAQVDFNKHVYLGLTWISGANELGRDMRDRAAGLAWRNIYPPSRGHRNLSWARGFFGIGSHGELPGRLEITWECRPYELGWLLYAFGGKGSSENAKAGGTV